MIAQRGGENGQRNSEQPRVHRTVWLVQEVCLLMLILDSESCIESYIHYCIHVILQRLTAWKNDKHIVFILPPFVFQLTEKEQGRKRLWQGALMKMTKQNSWRRQSPSITPVSCPVQLILTFHKDISGPLPSDPTDLGQGHPMLLPEEYLMMFDGQTNGNFKFCVSKYGQTSITRGRSLNRCKEQIP